MIAWNLYINMIKFKNNKKEKIEKKKKLLNLDPRLENPYEEKINKND